MPFRTSREDFNLSHVDTSMVTDLREFALNYFANNQFLASTQFMSLHKVKDTIINDRKNTEGLPYEREFDLLVKIEEIIPEPKSQNDEQEMSLLRVTDNSNLLFEIQVPSSLIPHDCSAESVIRINKLRKVKEVENDRLLVA